MMDRIIRARAVRRETWGALALALALLATPAAAQEDVEPSCRCVDRDGEVIENCRCMRGLELVAPRVAVGSGFFFERRSQIGVFIDYGQGDEHDRAGARIERVQEDSPAEEAGLQEGDLVVRVDGRSVFEPLDERAERGIDLDQSIPVQRFVRLVGALEPGEPVELEVLRDGRTRTLTITPERAETAVTVWSGEGPGVRLFGPGESRVWSVDPERLRGDAEAWRERLDELGRGWRHEYDGPGVFRFETPGREGEVRFRVDSVGGEPGMSFFRELRSDPCMELHAEGRGGVWVLGGTGNCIDGVELMELNPELGEYFGTDRGVLVADVADGSTLGLRPGDVLLAVDGREVEDPAHARRILASYREDEELRLRVRRQGEEMEVVAQRR